MFIYTNNVTMGLKNYSKNRDYNSQKLDSILVDKIRKLIFWEYFDC